MADLERMIGSAHSLPPGRASGSHYELVPVVYIPHIARAFGGPLYLPTRLPAGFIFSNWTLAPHDFGTDGRRALFVDFGRDGPVLEWSVYAGPDTLGLNCPGKHPRFTPSPSVTIGGHRIFHAVGVGHGWDAWFCVPARSIGNSRPLEVDLWYAAQLDSPAMRREAEEIIAAANLIRQ
jgi:hypothetical protein